MDKKEFTKLSALVDSEFTVEKVYFPKRKIYGVESDKGILDLSQGQIGSLLESVSKGGEATIIGRTFKVKSNGKSGMDIRYYLNPVAEEKTQGGDWDKAREIFEAKKEQAVEEVPSQDEIDADILKQIPF